jgi:hypothetical protein
LLLNNRGRHFNLRELVFLKMEDIVYKVEKIREELKNCWTMETEKHNMLSRKLREEEIPLRKATQEYIRNYLDSEWKGIHITKNGYFDRDGDLLKGLEYKIDREEIQNPHLDFLRDYIMDEGIVFLAVEEHNKNS